MLSRLTISEERALGTSQTQWVLTASIWAEWIHNSFSPFKSGNVLLQQKQTQSPPRRADHTWVLTRRWEGKAARVLPSPDSPSHCSWVTGRPWGAFIEHITTLFKMLVYCLRWDDAIKKVLLQNVLWESLRQDVSACLFVVGNYPGSLDILYSTYFEEEAKTGSIWHCPYPSQAMYTRGADGDSWGEFCAPSAPLLEESSGNRSPAAPLSRKVSALLAHSLGHCVAEGRPSLHHFRSFITGLNMLWFRARDRSFHTSSFPPCRCYPTPPPFLFYLLKVFLTGRWSTTAFKAPVPSLGPHFSPFRMKWLIQRVTTVCAEGR